MKKRTLAFIIASLMLFGIINASAASTGIEKKVTAVDGNVSILYQLEAEEGTPVMIFILPQIVESGRDVTVDKVQGLNSKAILSTLNVEYARTVKLSSGGVLAHTAIMKDELSTGICHVIINYIGSEKCESIGTFEHVGERDKSDLVDAINRADAVTCGPIIDKDINDTIDSDGETVEAKEILRKSSADTSYYGSLNENEKSEFHKLLYTFKGETAFELMTLVSSFNAAGVWMRLRLESDTMGVLNTYNGAGADKYWNIDIGEESDFVSNVSETEQAAILSKIKSAKYSDKMSLEKRFHDEVVMALFRGVSDREELAELIAHDSTYADDFSGVRNIIDNADLNEYELVLLYEKVLEKNSDVSTIVTISNVENLFKNSIPSGGGNGGGGGSSGGNNAFDSNKSSAIKYENDAVVSPSQPDVNPFPFKDVEPTHWAYKYVKKLHQNKVINGINEDSFAPEASVARQDFVKILIGALGIETTQANLQFGDVEDNSYYAPFVMTAFEKGIIAGISKQSFGVGVSIKREDAAVIIDRVLSQYGFNKQEDTTEFADIAEAADYASDSILRVKAAGIFSGDQNGNFNPKANLSRAETCAILSRLAELIKEV